MKDVFGSSGEVSTVPKTRRAVSKAKHALIGSYRVPLIQEATKVRNFSEEPKELSHALGLTADAAKGIISLLVEKGFLKRLPNGGLVDAEPNWYSAGFYEDPEVKRQNAIDFRDISDVAFVAQSELLDEMISFSWVMHAMQSSRVPRIKKLLAQFRKELSKAMEQNRQTPDQVYVCKIDFFPLSKPFKNKKKSD